jgi:hypothetical protein
MEDKAHLSPEQVRLIANNLEGASAESVRARRMFVEFLREGERLGNVAPLDAEDWASMEEWVRSGDASIDPEPKEG